MPHGSDILLSLFIVFVAAQIGAELAQRLKLPGVVGEIAAGCVVGPSLLGWVQPSEALDVLAEIGVVLLLFSVGLETRLDDMRRVGRSAFAVGVLGVSIPFALGSLWAHGSGFDWAKSLFVAAAFVAHHAEPRNGDGAGPACPIRWNRRSQQQRRHDPAWRQCPGQQQDHGNLLGFVG